MNLYVLIDDKKRPESKVITTHNFDLAYFKEMNLKGWGIYFAVNDFGPNPRQDKFCQKLRYVYGDLDIAKAGDGQTREARDAKKKVVQDALIAHCPPTMIIGTSNGVQPLWKLSNGSLDQKAHYVNVIKGVIEWSKQYGCMADSVYDTARVLRTPDFYHQKAEPYLCEIIFKSTNTYTLDELQAKFPYVEEKPTYVPPTTNYQLSPVDLAIKRIDIKELGTRAFASVGRRAEWDNQDRLVLDGRQTGTFQGRIGDRGFIASSSHEPYEGNHVTFTAQVLNITPKEARAWIIKEYNLNWETEMAKAKLSEVKHITLIKDKEKRYTWGTTELNHSMVFSLNT